MIEIKLTSEEAIAYLQNEKQEEYKYVKLLNDFNELQDLALQCKSEYDELKLNYDKVRFQTEVSNKVVEDSKLVKDIVKPKFASGFIPIVKETTYVVGTWSEGEVSLIEARMKLNDTNQDRSLEKIAASLNRTINSTRSKLDSLNIRVDNGMCYYKD